MLEPGSQLDPVDRRRVLADAAVPDRVVLLVEQVDVSGPGGRADRQLGGIRSVFGRA